MREVFKSSSQEEELEIKDSHYHPNSISPPVEDEEEISIMELGLLRLDKNSNVIHSTSMAGHQKSSCFCCCHGGAKNIVPPASFTTTPKKKKRRSQVDVDPTSPLSNDHSKQEEEEEEEEEEEVVLSNKKPKKEKDGFLDHLSIIRSEPAQQENNYATTASHLPPLPRSRPLRRTISDPSTAPTPNYQQVQDTPITTTTTNTTTSSTGLRRTFSDPSPAAHHHDNHHYPDPISLMVPSGDSQEAVSVEKNGDNLTINFQCPCSRAFQFLLSGGTCYYKLI